MKSTPTLRLSLNRLSILTVISLLAVATLLGIAASAHRANRAAKARAEQATSTKSAINLAVQNDKQPLAPNAATITATLTDNVSAATKVAPGGTINYTAVITNTGVTGTDDAGAVNYSHIIGANSTLVNGSIHASPIAFNNAYTTAIGNTLLEVSNSPSSTAPKVTAPGTLFDNDTISTAPDAIQLQSFQTPSANGGTVAVNADGSFTYLPAAGFTGTDTFTYTIRNSTDNTLQDTGIVTITVNSPRVWYVDNSGANGDGRSTSPFNTLAGAAAVDGAGDIIYIFTGGGNYTGGITLLNNEQVIGNGVALVVNTFTLRAAGSRPTVVNAGGNGITVGLNDTLSGFNFGACTGFAIQGASVGTLAVSNMLINNTSGGALDLTGVATPTVSVVLDSTTSTGGTSNVRLVGLNGTVTLGSGALSGSTAGATNHAFSDSGGNAGITFSGSITKANQGNVVNIASRTGGTVTLSGAINGSGSNGINCSSNTGGTIDFTNGTKTLNTGANAAVTLATNTGTTINFTGGGLNIDTTSGGGFLASGGGTISVTGTVNTIDATTGSALSVANTTIGASGLTFQNLTSNGSGSNNGIVLDTTGTNAGLTVTGTGAAATGGTISNKTGTDGQTTSGIGIYLNSTSSPSFARMQINDCQNFGIFGTTVRSFTLTDSVINGTNGTNENIDEASVSFTNLTGSATITNVSVSGTIEDNFRLINNVDRTIAGNPLNRITFTNFTCGAMNTTTGDNGLFIQAQLNAEIDVTIQNSTFTSARGDIFQFDLTNTSKGDLIFLTNTVSNNHPAIVVGGGGLALSGGGSVASNVAFTYDINGNSFRDARGDLLLIALQTGGGTFTGKIRNNTFGVAAVDQSGGREATSVEVRTVGSGNQVLQIDNNQIRQYGNFGILLQVGGQTANGNGSAGSMNATVTNNTINTPSSFVFIKNGFQLNSGTNAGDAFQVCLNLSGNTLGGSGQNGGNDFQLRNRFTTTDRLPGYGGANNDNAAVVAFEQAQNTGAETGNASNNVAGGSGGFVGGAACTLPPIPNPIDDNAFNHTVKPWDAPATALVQAKAPVAQNSIAATRIPQVSAKANGSSVTANAGAKATAVEIARTYRSERQLSHHAIQKGRTAAGSPDAPLADVALAIGTLPAAPAGKSITIKYAVTVNTPPLVREVTAQGSVSFTGGPGSPVSTTDPGPPIVAGATKTLIDTLMTWNGVTDTDWNTATNWTPPAGGSQYAPGVSNPAVNDVVIPNVGAQPNISATDIGIYSLNIANGRTLTITNPRTLTIGGSPGGDLTLDGIISGGNLNLGTGTHVINNAGGTGSISATNVATVLSGSTVTLANNLQMGALTINAGGSMIITNRTLSLNGSGAALAVAGGGTFTTTGSTVVYNGTAAQQAAGIAYNSLTINNSIGAHITGVTLTGNASVAGVLTLTSSDLDTTGAFTLTMPVAATSGPASGATDVVGNVKRTGFVSGGAALSFGNPFNTIKINSGAAPADINVKLAKNAPATYTTAVLRSYTITPNGANGPATLRLHYRQVELNGNSETPTANFNLRRGPTWSGAIVPTSRNVGVVEDNWLENNAVASFSEWTFAALAPTAAPGVVTGRIVDDHGMPVEGAVVRLQGTQNRKFITDANGVYRFENVETNGLYTVTPSRANYSFNPATRSFTQLGESTEAAFSATLATSSLQNPLDTPEYFVRQHYLDFLGREPDEAGFNFWSDQILECAGDAECTSRRRENGSAAFFLSIEFRKTGGLVAGLYRASYGVAPQYSSFMPDTRMVGNGVRVGVEGWEALLNANTEAFVNSFVNRPAFHQMYDGMADSLFVDTLISHTGVSFTSAERDALVGGLGTGQMTRAEALRSIAENSRFVDAKFNETFVMMEYFGYLRRDTDAGGFAFWLNKLNEFNGNFEQAEMVKAFIVSGEYRDRFPK